MLKNFIKLILFTIIFSFFYFIACNSLISPDMNRCENICSQSNRECMNYCDELSRSRSYESSPGNGCDNKFNECASSCEKHYQDCLKKCNRGIKNKKYKL